MTAENITPMSDRRPPTFTEQFMAEPVEVRRTPVEKARILARLTLELAALDNHEGRTHGDA
jgi:hypothetical protein